MLGSIISAGASLLGGIMGSNSQEKMAKQNIQLQKDFAQQGIRWKVADAKAAGLHPLAALGAQTHSFSPISVGGDPLSQGLASAGQDIGRAIDAKRTGGERLDAYTKTVQDLNLTRMGLENELLASQIAKTRGAGHPPPLPSPGDRLLVEGQGDSGLVKVQPLEQTSVAPGQPSVEAGAVPELGFARTPSGWAPVMSKDFQDRTEEDMLGTLAWNIRNRLAPSMSKGFYNAPQVARKEGEYWIYNPFLQQYQLVGPRPRYGFRKWYQ